MNDLILKGSEKTPHLELKLNGHFQFSGVSMPEDAATFYFDVIDWISDYYRTPQSETKITVKLSYLNSASESMLFKIFYALDRLQRTGKSIVSCDWYYDDEDCGMENYIKHIKEYAENITINVHPTQSLESQIMIG